MSQKELIQANIQVEAAQELGDLVRSLIQKIARGVRGLRSTDNVPETVQPDVMPQSPAEMPIGNMQVHEG